MSNRTDNQAERGRWSDAELTDLLRLASEAEAMAAGTAPEAMPRPSRGGVLRRIGWVVIPAAAAAGLMLAATAVLWQRPAPAGPSASGPVAGHAGSERVAGRAPAEFAALSPAGAPEASIVVAMFKDEQGRCRCVVTRGGEALGDRAAASLSEAELLALALSGLCSPDASKVVVIGLSGPAERLPMTAAAAQSLAACVEAGSSEGLTASCLGWACVPDGVTVSAATLALGSGR